MSRDVQHYKEWRASQRDHELELRRERTRKNYLNHWAKTTIYNHIKRDMIVDFEASWLEQKAAVTPCCEVCGDELRWEPSGKGMLLHNTPTLDRVSNERILTKDNVMILCNSCNAGKGAQNLDEYIAKCKRIANRFSGDD